MAGERRFDARGRHDRQRADVAASEGALSDGAASGSEAPLCAEAAGAPQGAPRRLRSAAGALGALLLLAALGAASPPARRRLARLAPKGSPPTVSVLEEAQLEQHEGVNCYPGMGGDAMPTADMLDEALPLFGCVGWCQDDAGCQGVVTLHGQDPGPCWVRASLTLSECVTGTNYDLWTKQLPPEEAPSSETAPADEIAAEDETAVVVASSETTPALEIAAEDEPAVPNGEAWILHAGLNCEDSALPEPDGPDADSTLEECQAACERTPQCEGLQRMSGHALGPCLLRASFNVDKCMLDTPYDLYAYEARASTSTAPPLPADAEKGQVDILTVGARQPTPQPTPQSTPRPTPRPTSTTTTTTTATATTTRSTPRPPTTPPPTTTTATNTTGTTTATATATSTNTSGTATMTATATSTTTTDRTTRAPRPKPPPTNAAPKPKPTEKPPAREQGGAGKHKGGAERRKQPDRKKPGSPSMYCFVVARAGTYEVEIVKMQSKENAGIYGCDAHEVLGDDPSVVDTQIDLVKAGTSKDNTSANVGTFSNAWRTVGKGGRYKDYDFTIKVDPDTVLVAHRLRPRLEGLRGNTFIPNCDLRDRWPDSPDYPMMLGSLEILSREAVDTFLEGGERCQRELPWQELGEDLFLHKCLALLGAEEAGDYSLLQDARCHGVDCRAFDSAAFHDFKSPEEWLDCWGKAVNRGAVR